MECHSLRHMGYPAANPAGLELLVTTPCRLGFTGLGPTTVKPLTFHLALDQGVRGVSRRSS
jgi:hypothetical protein